MINITLDKRDPKQVTLNQKMDFKGKVIIIMDDVANSGKTLLYALKPFLNIIPERYKLWYWWNEATLPFLFI